MSHPASQGSIYWLLGREGGLGLLPMQDSAGGPLLLVLGTSQGDLVPGAAWVLPPKAISTLKGALDRYEATGRLDDPASWPDATLWGSEPVPAL